MGIKMFVTLSHLTLDQDSDHITNVDYENNSSHWKIQILWQFQFDK